METEFKTCDLIEAAYLYYLGFNHEFDRSDPLRVVIRFRGDGELIVMKIRDLNEDRAKVSARAFAIALRTIKRAIIGETNYIPRNPNKMDSVQKPDDFES